MFIFKYCRNRVIPTAPEARYKSDRLEQVLQHEKYVEKYCLLLINFNQVP